MTQADLKHRLAAILAADAAGYSRLMGTDERGTLAALDKARAAFRKHVEANRGVVVDTAGDSVLALFELATGAVAASLAIQTELKAATETVPDDRRMHFRIGVHIGEVIEKADGTVYGNGINIAARLQARAPAGAICVSQTVYDTVSWKVPMQARFVGPESFKNIAEPIPIWLVVPEGIDLAECEASATQVQGQSAVDPKSVAVLPFTNMSDSKDTGYFADGIHEDLLTQLALLGEMKVVSRTSVMDYRDTKKNVRQIGKELGVRALVEGSVRRAGNTVRVNAQLIDSASDKHLWAKSYDRELNDIFAIQSELAMEIAKALKVTLAPSEREKLARQPTEDVQAYDLYLQAHSVFNRSIGTINEVVTIDERTDLLTKAVERDPRFAHAWAMLARDHALAHAHHHGSSPNRLALSRTALDRALSLAPDDLQVKLSEAETHLLSGGAEGMTNAARAFEMVLAKAPNNADALNGLAIAYRYQGRILARVHLLERALAVEPNNTASLSLLRNHFLSYRLYDRALAYQRRLIALRPDDITLQAKREHIEYLRTGTWLSYDSWRSTQLADAADRYQDVRHLDEARAVARRDFEEVMRLAQGSAKDERAARTKLQLDIVVAADSAIAFRAMGRRREANERAKEALRLLDVELANNPCIWITWYVKSSMHAVMNEPVLAQQMFEKAVEVARATNVWAVERAQRDRIKINALLGERDKSLEELTRQLALPGSHVHEFEVSVELANLWSDPRFEAVISNPMNRAPIPVVDKLP